MNHSQPRVLGLLPGIMPSTLMNVVKPFLALQRKGLISFQVALENYPANTAIKSADVVILCRNTEPKYLGNFDLISEHEIPVIYDLDDNLFEVPLNSVDGKYYNAPDRKALLEKYLRSANLVRVYSKPLLEISQEYNPNSKLVIPPMDWESLGDDLPGSQNQPVKIVYATSRQQDRLVFIFSEPLIQILEEYSSQVVMHFWGYKPEGFKDYSNVRFHAFNSNYDKFLRQFFISGFDIGLAPLNDDRFHRSKTNNKFREYGACYIAGIYSNVEVYSKCIEDGVSGLLVPNTPDAWYTAIKSLIDDPGLRERIAHGARQQVESVYSNDQFQDVWMEQITSVLQNQSRASSFSPGNQKGSNNQSKGKPIMSPLKQWREKIKRAFKPDDGAGSAAGNFWLHFTNFWWLFKLNTLKRT